MTPPISITMKTSVPIIPGLDFFSFSSSKEPEGAIAGVAMGSHLEVELCCLLKVALPVRTDG
jgi:hypothetical protein